MPWPHPAVPSPTLALAGWCPLSPAGAQTTQLLVEPSWRPAVLWDRVTLTCQGSGTTGATTWYKDGQRWGHEGRDHFTVNESGTYTCDRRGTGRSPPVSVLDDPLVLQVPAQALLEGDTVTLRCRCRQDSHLSRVRFYRDEKDLGVSLRGTELSLSRLQLHHSGRYSCGGLVGSFMLRSAAVTVTVHVAAGVGGALLFLLLLLGVIRGCHWWHRVEEGEVLYTHVVVTKRAGVPVAKATITPGPLAHQVCAGDPVTLRCSVQVGSAPVTFTWLHNGQEVARGPLLELRDIDVGHSGTYQCVATNQLGQDGHRVFRALSPDLALEVTPGSPWPPGSSRTGHPRVSPSPAPPRDPQVTNAELSGPHKGQRDPCDYESVL
ncbi:high affinity immunoglobulin epsilon receptor subunit alpha-like [Geothlypis trichas]